MDTSLAVRHLERRFGQVRAVDDVSFDVPDGHMVGFVGGNGAGKTTTMRMIMGLLQPDAGHVLWGGRAIDDVDRRGIGYMPEERGLYPKQPVLDQLVYLARLRGQERASAQAEARGLLERFHLADRSRDKLEKLSLGNQQRVQIAAAVMADPHLLVLDEPFSGLDPEAVDAMADLLREYTARGVPVLFSSHQLDLVERLCDRLVILSHGHVAAAGTQEDLRATGPERHRIVTDADLGWLRGASGVTVLDVDAGSAIVEFTEDAASRPVLDEVLRRGELIEFTRIRPSLAQIYREVSA